MLTLTDTDVSQKDRSPKAGKTGAATPQDAYVPASEFHGPHNHQSEGPPARPPNAAGRYARQPVLHATATELGSSWQDERGFSNPLFQEEPDRGLGVCQPAEGLPPAEAGRAAGGRMGGEGGTSQAGGFTAQAEPLPGQKPSAWNVIPSKAAPSPLHQVAGQESRGKDGRAHDARTKQSAGNPQLALQPALDGGSAAGLSAAFYAQAEHGSEPVVGGAHESDAVLSGRRVLKEGSLEAAELPAAAFSALQPGSVVRGSSRNWNQ